MSFYGKKPNGVSFNWQQNTRDSLRLGFDKFAYTKKSQNIYKNIVVVIMAIVAALFISLFIAMAIYGKGSLFGGIIKQIFITPFAASYWQATVSTIAIFAVAALSFIFAERVGLFNIGISGQMLFGAQMAILFAWFAPNTPNVLGQLMIIIIAMICGSLLATVIGALKVYLNISEVITSIMFNWIVYFCGSYMMATIGGQHGWLDSSQTNTNQLSENFHIAINSSNTTLAGSWLPLLIIVVLVISLSFILLNVSLYGKKASSIGKSITASQYAGINVNKQRLLTMAISGALAGLLGAILYVGKDNALPVTIIAKTIPQDGFNGISVGLIAMSNPIAVLPISVLFSMIDTSKATISQVCSVDPNVTNLMFGIVVYGAAIITVFYRFTPILWVRKWLHWKNGDKIYSQYLENLQDNIKLASDHTYYLKKTCRDFKKLNYLKNKYKKLINTIDIDDKAKEYISKKYEILKKNNTLIASVKTIKNLIKEQSLKLEADTQIRNNDNFKALDKIAKIKYNAEILENKINTSLTAKANVELFKSLGVDSTKLNDLAYVKLCINNVKRMYSLDKKILNYKYKFNLITNDDTTLDSRHSNFLFDNKENPTIHKLVALNSTAYKEYNATIRDIINLDPLNFHITYTINKQKVNSLPRVKSFNSYTFKDKIVIKQSQDSNKKTKVDYIPSELTINTKNDKFIKLHNININKYKDIYDFFASDSYKELTYDVYGPKTYHNDKDYPILGYKFEYVNSELVLVIDKKKLVKDLNKFGECHNKCLAKEFKHLLVHKLQFIILLANYDIAIKLLENAKQNYAKCYFEMMKIIIDKKQQQISFENQIDQVKSQDVKIKKGDN